MDNKKETDIKAMIISVGGTPAPIVKAICEYKPEFISFFASQETCDLVKGIKDEVLSKCVAVKSELTLADDVNDLFHCHEKAEEAVRRVLSRGYNKDEVIVDYTGGTKNMSVSLALAAIGHGFCFSYVGGKERTKNGIGTVINGKEQVYPCINPWDFLAVEEKKKIALLFNQYQFKAAKEMIDDLCGKNIKNRALFKKLGLMVEGYSKWDLFRHQEALSLFERAKIDDMDQDDDERIRAFARETTEKKAFLSEAVSAGKNGRIPCPQYLLDLYANAERRFMEGKFDDAILRIYRIVELSAQERLLRNYSIVTSDVKKEQIPEKLRESYAKQYENPRDRKIKVPLEAGFTLLNALGDEIGMCFEEKKKEFQKIQSSRNSSFLAHGFESAKDTSYLTLRNFVLSLNLFKQEDAPAFPILRL